MYEKVYFCYSRIEKIYANVCTMTKLLCPLTNVDSFSPPTSSREIENLFNYSRVYYRIQVKTPVRFVEFQLHYITLHYIIGISNATYT